MLASVAGFVILMTVVTIVLTLLHPWCHTRADPAPCTQTEAEAAGRHTRSLRRMALGLAATGQRCVTVEQCDVTQQRTWCDAYYLRKRQVKMEPVCAQVSYMFWKPCCQQAKRQVRLCDGACPEQLQGRQDRKSVNKSRFSDTLPGKAQGLCKLPAAVLLSVSVAQPLACAPCGCECPTQPNPHT